MARSRSAQIRPGHCRADATAFPFEVVVENQRQRLLAATAQALADRATVGMRQTRALDGMEPEIVQLVLMPCVGVEEAARVAGSDS
jgi:hypothetical protein